MNCVSEFYLVCRQVHRMSKEREESTVKMSNECTREIEERERDKFTTTTSEHIQHTQHSIRPPPPPRSYHHFQFSLTLNMENY